MLLFDQWSRFCVVVSLYLRRKIQLSPCPYGSHIPFPGLYMSPLCLWTLEAAQVFSPSPSTHLLICSTLKPRAIFHQGFPELHCLTSFIFQNTRLPYRQSPTRQKLTNLVSSSEWPFISALEVQIFKLSSVCGPVARVSIPPSWRP